MTLEQQFIKHQKSIETYLFHKTGGNRNLAQDLSQDLYLKIRKIAENKKYVEEGKFFYWLKTIASNMVIDHYRSESRKPKTSNDAFAEEHIGGADLWDLHGEIDDEPYQDTWVEPEQSEALHKAIAELPDLQRELIHMRYYRNMSYKEIVLETGEKQSNLLPRMHYAMKKLKLKLS